MHHLKLSWLLCVATAFVSSVGAQVRDLPRAEPESVGMSSERLGRIATTLRDDVAARKIPGAVLLVARQGKVVQYEAIGKLDPAAGDAPMTKDAIFRIYSMSKPITSVTAMMLVEEGKLKLSDPVTRWIPELGGMQVLKDAAGDLTKKP